jgi:hypothetical protein
MRFFVPARKIPQHDVTIVRGFDVAGAEKIAKPHKAKHIESKALFYNRLSLVICILDFVARSLRCPQRFTLLARTQIPSDQTIPSRQERL